MPVLDVDIFKYVVDNSFAIAVTIFLLVRFDKKLDKVVQSIEKHSKAVLLLVLAENGTKEKAKEIAKQMLESEPSSI